MSTTSALPPQGLQSCLEPFVHHPTLLNDQCKKPFLPINHQSSCPNEGGTSSWSLFLAITNTKLTGDGDGDGDTEQVYVHPLARSWSSSLSERSLEICTESLGSESGTYIDSISEPEFEQRNSKTLEKRGHERTACSVIPPPLTSIHHYCVHLLQIHREEGRLVIKASRFQTCRRCFKSERGNGRLRMSVVQDVEGEDDEEAEIESEIEDGNSKTGGKLGGEWCSSGGGAGGRCIGIGMGEDELQKSKQGGLPSYPICVAMS